ncbi:Glycylpeptide N-tetradecanoyltransferase 2 [Sciurus carolinensis]|uniref:Glycylpeptide N-tetradecanoyltransferase 2 n=1 Tax=Sciurus carolinensis TaxID=30640 RepID=A0AA41N779_SCICA|nr:Glycylpeptide N-tetradecanoyltransferase 2 [Sciurus carolinensis]
MVEDSESAASQQSLELDDQDTWGIDGDNEEETEHAKGSPAGDLGAKKKKKKQKRKKEKPNSGGTSLTLHLIPKRLKFSRLQKIPPSPCRSCRISREQWNYSPHARALPGTLTRLQTQIPVLGYTASTQTK